MVSDQSISNSTDPNAASTVSESTDESNSVHTADESTATETSESSEPAADDPLSEDTPATAAETVVSPETDPTAAPEAAAPIPDIDVSADTTTESEPQEGSIPRRKVALNPTGELKAIPNAPVTDGRTPSTPDAIDKGEESDESQDADESQAADELKEPRTSTVDPVPILSNAPIGGIVEIPNELEMDATLEAEIQAAMQSDEQAAQVQVASDESEEQEPTADATVEDNPETGSRIKGTVQAVHGENVFLELGFRSPGVLPIRQIQSAEPPNEGQHFEVVVTNIDEDEGLIHVSLPGGRQKLAGNWNAVAEGQIIECNVEKTNKGGLQVSVGNIRGFLPAGQIDINYVDNLEPFVGQKLTVKIIEANRQKRNLVVSRRAFLQEERKETEQRLWGTLAKGQEFSGTVKTIKNYGAFIDIGGIDGFLHIGEISWSRINHPSELLKQGQTIDVKILKLDEEKKRISLSMKQMSQNPWATVVDRYQKGTTVSGNVTRTENFGAFVELEPGVEGLVHISELDYKRVHKVTDVLSIGQEIEVQIVEVNPDRRRIGLSLKALKPKPEDQPAEPEAVEDAETASKPKGPLKGGIGPSEAGGGLFGNPKDFS